MYHRESVKVPVALTNCRYFAFGVCFDYWELAIEATATMPSRTQAGGTSFDLSSDKKFHGSRAGRTVKQKELSQSFIDPLDIEATFILQLCQAEHRQVVLLLLI
ncbi:uncharacterized protein [Littorina saxatilis]|uniref:uncharacterized protein isoform X2 n=1 Tax=Littorina saxatilis TaxID=31220 RepID=UPI0038B4B822